MCGLYPGEEEEALRHSLTPAVFRLDQAEALARAVTRMGLGQSAPIHLKIDTGMARLGLPLAELKSFAEGVQRLPQIELEGVFSHLASSEVLDDEDTATQIRRYEAALRSLAEYGLHPRLRHLANSGAVGARPNTWYNFVRPGIGFVWLRATGVPRWVPGPRHETAASEACSRLEDARAGIARCARRPATGIQRRLRHARSGANCGCLSRIWRRSVS